MTNFASLGQTTLCSETSSQSTRKRDPCVKWSGTALCSQLSTTPTWHLDRNLNRRIMPTLGRGLAAAPGCDTGTNPGVLQRIGVLARGAFGSYSNSWHDRGPVSPCIHGPSPGLREACCGRSFGLLTSRTKEGLTTRVCLRLYLGTNSSQTTAEGLGPLPAAAIGASLPLTPSTRPKRAEPCFSHFLRKPSRSSPGDLQQFGTKALRLRRCCRWCSPKGGG